MSQKHTQALADLEEVRRAVFGNVGDEPDVYADYDRLCALQVKMRDAIAALQPPKDEKRFTLTFSMENFGRVPTLAIMDVLRHVSGNVKTSRWSGTVNDREGKPIGEWLTTWRADPPGTPPLRAYPLISKAK